MRIIHLHQFNGIAAYLFQPALHRSDPRINLCRQSVLILRSSRRGNHPVQMQLNVIEVGKRILLRVQLKQPYFSECGICRDGRACRYVLADKLAAIQVIQDATICRCTEAKFCVLQSFCALLAKFITFCIFL